MLGYVTQTELEALYRRARIFAFPSLDEGFGMPVLDAMANSVPVITSQRSALPEVAGDAALLVNPDDPEEIAANIRQGGPLGLFDTEGSVKAGLEAFITIKLKIGFFLASGDLDPLNMTSFIGTLKEQLCKAGNCPTVALFKDHSHMSEVFSPNTADDSVTGPILKWMKSVK